MKYKILAVVFFIFANVYILSAQQQFVYTIQYAKSYRGDLLDKYMGCKQKSSIIYGTYVHPGGIKDALYVYLNQGVYQTRLSCNSQNNFVKIFGTQQNYHQLIATDPTTVANHVRLAVGRINPNYIINWKCPLNLDTQNAKNWLLTFIEKLSPTDKIYLKAPASYFCYQINNGLKYLHGLKTNNLIVEMYGQQPGMYTTYESIFEKDANLSQSQQNYNAECPEFPSYSTLKKNYPGIEIFIEKTLQNQQAGFIGPKFKQYLQKAKSVYGKTAFFDSFPQQIIQL